MDIRQTTTESTRTIQTTLLGLSLAACYASTAHATVIYNGPASYVIDSPVYDDIEVANPDAVVNVSWGGEIHGSATSSYYQSAAHTASGTLEVSANGRIIAEPGRLAINMHSPSRTVVRMHDQAAVTGDILQLWTDPGWRNEATANKRLYLAGEAVVDGNVSYSGFMRMDHQALITGDLRTSEGNMNLDMRNGVVEGVLQLAGAGQEHIFNMSGGSILGGLRGNAADVNMLMTGGYIGGGLRTGAILDAHIDGGSIDGGIAINTYHLGSASLRVITGQFDAVAGDYLLSMTRLPVGGSVLTSRLDIRGGEWGYNEQGLGFFLDGFVNFDIRGSEWTYADGWLSGYLMDGSWFNNRLTFGSNYQGIFTIHDIYANVPEPGTPGMLATGMFGVMLARRRRRTRSSS